MTPQFGRKYQDKSTQVWFHYVIKQNNFACFFCFLYKGDTFVSSSCKSSFEKGQLHVGTNSFLLEKAPFQQGTKTILKGPPLKAYQFVLK